MIPDELSTDAELLLETCRRAGLKLATVESCTGGLVAAALTGIAGSSDVVDRGFVTYTNEAKTDLAGVPAELFEQVGAVSEQVARAMAEGGVAHSRADIAVGITGVAGPGGGSAEKPVGLVHLAGASQGHRTRLQAIRYGDLGRGGIRLATVDSALELLRQCAMDH